MISPARRLPVGRLEPEPFNLLCQWSVAGDVFEQGSEAYALGNYEEAVERFEHSYGLSNRTALLFNLGQAYAKWYDVSQDVEHIRKAKKLFENYIIFLDSQEQPDAEERTGRIPGTFGELVDRWMDRVRLRGPGRRYGDALDRGLPPRFLS